LTDKILLDRGSGVLFVMTQTKRERGGNWL
jgi:hypothetical protein